MSNDILRGLSPREFVGDSALSERLHRVLADFWHDPYWPDHAWRNESWSDRGPGPVTTRPDTGEWVVEVRVLESWSPKQWDSILKAFDEKFGLAGTQDTDFELSNTVTVLVNSMAKPHELRLGLIDLRERFASEYFENAQTWVKRLFGSAEDALATKWRMPHIPRSLEKTIEVVASIYVDFSTEIVENRTIITESTPSTHESERDWEPPLDLSKLPVTEARLERERGIAEALGRVVTSLRNLESVKDELDESVASARVAGSSWEAIGEAAGVTQQAAHQRWAKKVATILDDRDSASTSE